MALTVLQNSGSRDEQGGHSVFMSGEITSHLGTRHKAQLSSQNKNFGKLVSSILNLSESQLLMTFPEEIDMDSSKYDFNIKKIKCDNQADLVCNVRGSCKEQ